MEEMALKRASSSPHIHAGRTVQGVMLEMIVALAPAGVFGVYTFGWRALLIIAVSALSAVFWDCLLYTSHAERADRLRGLLCLGGFHHLGHGLPRRGHAACERRRRIRALSLIHI